jgi:hypothetical protein
MGDKHVVSDKAFEGMLKIVKDKHPENNELLSTSYEEKQTVCPLGWRFRGSMLVLCATR